MLVCCTFLACSGTRTVRTRQNKPASEGKPVQIAGQSCRLFLPPGYVRSKRYPLLLTVVYPKSYRKLAAAAVHKRKMIVLVCRYWSPRVLAEVKRNYSIDENRVYLTGWSAGGAATLGAAFTRPDLFAAINPMFQGISFGSFRSGGQDYLYLHHDYLENAHNLPLRFTPETVAFNNQLLFHYYQARRRQTGATTTCIPFQEQVSHSQQGLETDFPRALDFLLRHTRKQWPRTISYTHRLGLPRLYYLRGLQRRGSGFYAVAARVVGKQLQLETSNLRSLVIHATDLQQLGVGTRLLVNGVSRELAPLMQQGKATVALKRDMDQKVRSKYGRKNCRILGARGALQVSGLYDMSVRLKLRCRLESGQRKLIVECDRSLPLVSAMYQGKALPVRALWHLPTARIPFAVTLKKAPENNEVVLDVVLRGGVPVNHPATPVPSIRLAEYFKGLFEVRLGDLLPTVFGNPGPYPARLRLHLNHNAPEQAMAPKDVRVHIVADMPCRALPSEGRERGWELHVSGEKGDFRRSLIIMTGMQRYRLDLPFNLQYFGMVSPWGKAYQQAFTNTLMRCGRVLARHFPAPQPSVLLGVSNPLHFCRSFTQGKARPGDGTCRSLVMRDFFTPFQSRFHLLDVDQLRTSRKVWQHGRHLRYHVSQALHQELAARTLVRCLFRSCLPRGRRLTPEQQGFVRGTGRWLTYALLREAGLLPEPVYRFGFLAREMSRLLGAEQAGGKAETRIAGRSFYLLTYLELLLGRKKLFELVGKNLSQLCHADSPWEKMSALVQGAQGLRLPLQGVLARKRFLPANLALVIRKQADPCLVEVSITCSQPPSLPVLLELFPGQGASLRRRLLLKEKRTTLRLRLAAPLQRACLNRDCSLAEPGVADNQVQYAKDLSSLQKILPGILVRALRQGSRKCGISHKDVLDQMQKYFQRAGGNEQALKVAGFQYGKTSVRCLIRVGSSFWGADLVSEGNGYRLQNLYYI